MPIETDRTVVREFAAADLAIINEIYPEKSWSRSAQFHVLPRFSPLGGMRRSSLTDIC